MNIFHFCFTFFVKIFSKIVTLKLLWHFKSQKIELFLKILLVAQNLKIAFTVKASELSLPLFEKATLFSRLHFSQTAQMIARKLLKAILNYFLKLEKPLRFFVSLFPAFGVPSP